MEHLNSGNLLRLQTLWASPGQEAAALPLLLVRKNQEILLPDPAIALQRDDKILLAYGNRAIERRLELNMFSAAHLYYSIHGKEKTKSPVLAYIFRKFE